jgi:hypothetical protein
LNFSDRLDGNVIEKQLATIAEFGSSQIGPNGEPHRPPRAFLAAQAPLKF